MDEQKWTRNEDDDLGRERLERAAPVHVSMLA